MVGLEAGFRKPTARSLEFIRATGIRSATDADGRNSDGSRPKGGNVGTRP